LGLEPFLIPDKLFLHQKVILDSFHFEEFQAAPGMGSDERQLGCSLWSLNLLTLLANSCGDWGLIFLLPVFVIFLVSTCSSSTGSRMVLALYNTKYKL